MLASILIPFSIDGHQFVDNQKSMVCQDKLQISSVGPRHLDFPMRMHFDSQGEGYKNTTFLNNISYFTDVDSELDGGTAMLTGSHLTDTVWIMRTHSVAVNDCDVS